MRGKRIATAIDLEDNPRGRRPSPSDIRVGCVFRGPAAGVPMARARHCLTRRARVISLAALAFLAPATDVAATQGPATALAEPDWRVAAQRWDAGTLGHHRAIVEVSAPARAVRVVIPWRRRDPAPETRHLVVTDATGRRVTNVRRGAITREAGELWFEPVAGPGTYHVYYLPFVMTGRSNYPTATYPPPQETADAAWLGALDAGAVVGEGRTTAFEAIDALHRFDPMEVIATRAEVDALRAQRPGARYLVFPEDRLHPIRMRHDVPRRWARAPLADRFAGEALRGEFFAFQVGVLALAPLEHVRVSFSDLEAAGGRRLAASTFTCLNTGGVNWKGEPFTIRLDVPADTVQAIWCGADVPADAAPGAYAGTARVLADNAPPTTMALSLVVRDEVARDGGAHEPWTQTRLKWLNSTLAQQNDVIAPYTPLQVTGQRIDLLGRRITLGASGLPASIQTFFTDAMTAIGPSPTDVIARPIGLVAERADGTAIAWTTSAPAFTSITPGTVVWTATSASPDLELEVEGTLEFDGFLSCTMALTATRDVDLGDVRLELPYTAEASTYLMGLGQKGGRRPAALDWRWDVARKNQDGAWIGGVNAGLFFSLRDERYVRPLNTNFYLQKPLVLPASWGNAGRGGITLAERDGVTDVRAFSGARRLRAGERLRFDVQFIVTPFHPIDTDAQWRTRFYHRFAPVADVAAGGATVVNVHHANPINPWINYPFIAHREAKAYVDEAHARGLKVKIYNTVRELSNRAYELFPLRSLGHEVFSPGPGGGFPWLQEHLGDDYIAAWFVPDIQDAAIVNSGMSRWHNYYVEGMRWLARYVGIDGIYLDDVAFDRTTMKRVKRVLTEGGRPGILDLHSANQFNERDGFVNSAVLYLEHFPYLDRLWFGEYFDYEANGPDFFLTEISGIPFGLMGEMLEKGGNPWRGMVYGMTNRLPWSDDADPRPLWKAWDDFGMAGSEMVGYWARRPPVTTGREDVLATVYRKPGERKALVALASWAPGAVEVALAIDWASLGIDPARARIEAPAIARFQEARRFAAGEPVPVAPGKGWLLVVSEAEGGGR